ncbi:hypothetical protein KSP39_PZI019895 [Platanthera zijinensis]|uniref:Heptahelical transmembrane protein 4 n=1 Tax=Platanthera zijinensis TaxID=2320716 RepID=A0AAP0B1P9_9ASPA
MMDGEDAAGIMHPVAEAEPSSYSEGRVVGGKNGKGRRLWKKVKYQLVEYHSLPAYLKDNEYILGYYRSEWPLKQILLSIFTIHNETLNVWTHLIGFFLFLSLTIYTAMKVPKVADIHPLQQLSEVLRRADLQHSNRLNDVANLIVPLSVRQIPRWPFFAFLGGAMFCLLASSVCHLLSCHSRRMAYIMLRLDYAGIAALISTSFYPPSVLLIHVRPILLQSLPRRHHSSRVHVHHRITASDLPKSRIPGIKGGTVLRHGGVGSCAGAA